MYVENKLVRQGPAVSLDKTNDILIGYLLGLGYKVLVKTHRKDLQSKVMEYMERKKLWKLGEDKAKFFSKRGSRKRNKSQVKKIVQRKRRKLSDDKKSQSLQKPAPQKPKHKLSGKKKKSKKEKEDDLPERYLLPDERKFDEYIYKKKKYRIIPIKRDGNCLFRAVADQVYCDPNLHDKVKNFCANYMQEEEKYFSEFYTFSKPYTKYISDLRKDGAWGGNFEIIALSQSYKRSIELYEHSEKPRLFQCSNNQGNNGPPMRLFYRNNHYASIRSDGVGLNLPKKSGPVKAKTKVTKKKIAGHKKKSKKKQQKEILPERFLYPDSLIFEKFLYDCKKYRIDPIERDGNCLFRAVAGAVWGDTEKYDKVRKKCADFMVKEKGFFTPFVVQINNDGIMVRNFDDHISMLRQDAAWGGDPEIIALSGVFNCYFEVYKFSEIPDERLFPNVIRPANRPIRLFYRHSHYSIVRSDGIGNQLFNFEGLQEGELEMQMEILSMSKDPENYSEAEVHSSDNDQEEAQAKKISRGIDKAQKNYKLFYASRIIKQSPNEQN